MIDQLHNSKQHWIVCMGGEDWWYHSHAHFDIQVMKRLSERCPVLYVCSIGMRMPSLRRDAQFWTRIGNKLRSVRHALKRVAPCLWVYSPLPLPLYTFSAGREMNESLLAGQLRMVFGRLGIRRPLMWINTPTGWPVISGLGRRGLVYQRTDEYAEYRFDNFNADYVREIDRQLVQQAGLVLHVDEALHDRTSGANSLLLEQGVDERFLEPHDHEAVPRELVGIPRPIVGYVGTVEPHKFDASLVHDAARRMPDVSFVIVGPHNQNASGLHGLANVHLVGPRRHEEIPAFVRAFDVCMLPTAHTQWGEHCNPIKLMEYLAAGKPVIATDTPASRRFARWVRIGDEAAAWERGIRHAIRDDGQALQAAREHVAECTWARQADRIWSELTRRGLLDEDAVGEGRRVESAARLVRGRAGRRALA